MSWLPTISHPEEYDEFVAALDLMSNNPILILRTNAPLYTLGLATKLAVNQNISYCYIPFWDCRDEADAILCFSESLNLPPQSSLVSIAQHLTQESISTIIAAGISNRCFSIIETISSIHPQIKWIGIGELNLQHTASVSLTIDALEDPSNLLSDQEQLRTAEAILAFLPAGLDLPHSLEEDIAFPSPPDRIQLHPNLAAFLRERLEPTKVLDILARHLGPLLEMADGAPLPNRTRVPHLFALRWLSETTTDEELSFKATLAQSRLRIAWGQSVHAQKILESAIARSPNLPSRTVAVIYATIGEALLYIGQHQSAQSMFNRATERAQRSKDSFCTCHILRRQGEFAAALGKIDQAEHLFRAALSIAQHTNNELERASLLRNVASLSISQGESIGAMSILDQTLSSQTRPTEESNRRITQSEGAFLRGNNTTANRYLIESESFDSDTPHILANRLHRRTIVLLSDNEIEEAINCGKQAVSIFQETGEMIALSSLYRILGDAYICLGKRQIALDYFREAMVTQLRIQDYHGLHLTLEHTIDLIQDEYPEAAQLLSTFHDELKASL